MTLTLAAILASGCLGIRGSRADHVAEPTACPELTLDPLPAGHAEGARKRLLPDRAVSPLRVDLEGPGGRTITLLSGSTGEIGGQELARRQVLDHDGRLVLTPAGSFALLWLDPNGGGDCQEYGVIAKGYAQAEVEALIPSLVVVRPD